MPVGSFRIPLIGGLTQTEQLRLDRRIYESIRPFVVKKPERKMGAVWTSDKVAQRRPILMCEACWRHYIGWWRKAEYKADWGWKYTSNCDGCSEAACICTMFLPEDYFYTVLDRNHGRIPQP
jgi:hypothetical protein